MNTNLQQLRKIRRISQSEVAKLLNVSPQAYSRYERGERELGYENLIKLANYFDVSIDYLLGNSTFYYPDRLQKSVLSLSDGEETILRYFRALSSELQYVAIETTRVLAGIPTEKK